MRTRIYSNEDLFSDENIQAARENLIDGGKNEDDISESDILEELDFIDRINWEDAYFELKRFFEDKAPAYLMQGTAGTWMGPRACGHVFTEFSEFIEKAMRDCEYLSIYDENGHFFVECVHHDGRNIYEVKAITRAALAYIENWASDKTDQEKHATVFGCNFFSSLLHFARDVYGVKEKRPRRPSKRTAPRPAPVRTAA